MKISSKYEKELRKLFELSKKTYIINFQLRNDELISNFSDVTDEEKINIIKDGLNSSSCEIYYAYKFHDWFYGSLWHYFYLIRVDMSLPFYILSFLNV